MLTRINSMHGLGDNIYQRPFVKALAAQSDVIIDTSWPELYADIPGVRFLKPSVPLRTQQKNYEQSDTRWVKDERPDRVVHFGYGQNLHVLNIPETMKQCTGISNPPDMDLPDFGESPVSAHKPIAFIRPVTERREWRNSARNPKPEYISATVGALRATHYIVSVADIEGDAEWLVDGDGGVHYADLRLEKGQLSMRQMLSLLQHSDMVVGGMGFILPASIAAKRNAIIIGGGQMGHNHISRVTAPHLDTSRIHYAEPTNPCPCKDMRHDCDKTIEGFSEWLEECLTCI